MRQNFNKTSHTPSPSGYDKFQRMISFYFNFIAEKCTVKFQFLIVECGIRKTYLEKTFIKVDKDNSLKKRFL